VTRLALVIIVAVIGLALSPLRAVAATVPVLIAYDAAVGLTATTRGEAGASLRSDRRNVPAHAYDDGARGYVCAMRPRAVDGAGVVHAYDGTLNFDRREVGEGAMYAARAPTTAAEGTATIFNHGGGHTSILVKVGEEALHTELTARAGSAIVRPFAGTALPTIESVEVALPDGQGALNFQRSAIGNAGEVNAATNSCVTHCGDVLRSGGVDGVPSTSRGIVKWLRGLF
jgi:hypothetical protein